MHLRTESELIPVDVELPWRSDALEGCDYHLERAVEGLDDPFGLGLTDPDGEPMATGARRSDVRPAAQVDNTVST